MEDRARAPRRQRVATALHYDDLPRLADAGLVEYDRWCGEIRYNRDDRGLSTSLGPRRRT
jgi:hypothetical protein